MQTQNSISKLFLDQPARWLLLIAFAMMAFSFRLGSRGLSSSQEARAAIITRNMFKSGDYFSPVIHGDETGQKPIFFYWTAAASCFLLGTNEVGVRFPSMLGAILSVVFTVLLARKIYDENIAFLAGLILATMTNFVHFGRTARIDMVLTAFLTASLYLLYRGYIEERKANWLLYLFYVVLAISVLTKGPVGVVLIGGIVLFYAWREKNWKILWEVKPVSGLFIGLAIACPGISMKA